MKKNESVTKIMSANPVSIGQNEPVSAARKLLDEKGIHHLPITDGDQLVGILTSNDFLRVSFGEFGNQDARSLDAILDHTYKLADLMNADPVSIGSHDTVRDAATILANHNFHSVPVVDGARLVGIVTSSDLIQYLLDQY
ncbi:CBS domain-containing protein [Fuerstiella marisgermanici]|uniref:Hypoxic response protein 1 n=1 Tax=Fuerstiella marisgermanici TaxID=1891926 RepID=A0A1P8WA22_9PLAN|nr:CBS domain-containing protein [Fuerstiella marisgermanici]APZ90913.1 Hypoxic response protein 1 [Fuerstiella marisgermanici]